VLERDILSVAHENDNIVMGISKTSTLRLKWGQPLQHFLRDISGPCYVRVHEFIRPKSFLRRVKGTIFSVKFASRGLSFRTDVSPPNGVTHEEALGIVAANAHWRTGGYPWSLYLADKASQFTWPDLIQLQGYAAWKYDMEVRLNIDMRETILRL
jgi:hypothetical protein